MRIFIEKSYFARYIVAHCAITRKVIKSEKNIINKIRTYVKAPFK